MQVYHTNLMAAYMLVSNAVFHRDTADAAQLRLDRNLKFKHTHTHLGWVTITGGKEAQN